MIDLQDIFERKDYKYDDGIYKFSEVNPASDHWREESCTMAEEQYLNEFFPENAYSLGLEIGAGIGRCTAPLTRICDHLVALEPSLHAIKYVKKRELRNITLVNSYDMRLPFHSNIFDFVASITIIEHIAQRHCVDFLLEHYRVLRPGGILLIRNDTWFYRILERLGYFQKARPDPTHINMMTPRKLRRILVRCGFEIVRADYFPFYRYTKRRLPLMDIMATKGNFVCRKPF